MVVFNKKYMLQQILKKRHFRKNKYPVLKYGTLGMYSQSTFRFEYKYCLFFRKFFKKIFKNEKRKIATFNRRKTWLFIRPNYVLTHKSKNARMGKGKGNFKRWCTIVYPGRTFIEHINVPPYLYSKYCAKMKIKMKIAFRIVTYLNFLIKQPTLHSNKIEPTDRSKLFRIKKKSNLLFN